MWESLKIPVVGELAVKLSTGKSTVRGLAEGMMVNKQRATNELLDEWWAPMTFHDNIRATYLLERRLDWAQTEELLPDAQLQIPDGCGHTPQPDCPEPVNSHLWAFFADRGESDVAGVRPAS
jgi:pimeloyl-ACP methyl ester carboxylesterase